jgi:hypothetical protein
VGSRCLSGQFSAALLFVLRIGEACALKPKCCPNVPARKIARSVHEAARDKARAIAKTEAYAVSCRERRKVEMLFAHRRHRAAGEGRGRRGIA